MNPSLKKKFKSVDKPNEFTPALAVCDIVRKQFFTTYDIALMNRIREIKFNQTK